MPRLPAPMAMRLPLSASACRRAARQLGSQRAGRIGEAVRLDVGLDDELPGERGVGGEADRHRAGYLLGESGRLYEVMPRAARAASGAAVIAFRVAMTRLNSFGARTTLQTPGGAVEYVSLPALERAGFPQVAKLPVLAAHPAREPAAHGGRRLRQEGRHRRARQLEPGEAHRARDRVLAGARPAAGLHRRPRRGRPRRHARRRRRARRRPEAASTRCSRSSSSSTTRCRSTTSASRPPSS